MYKKGFSLIFLLFCLALLSSKTFADHPSVGLTTGKSAPILTSSANTLKKGQWTATLFTELDDNNAISDARLIRNAEEREEQDVHSISTVEQYSLNFAKGITDKFTLALQIPYITRNNILEAEIEEGETEAEVIDLGKSEGFGDARLFGSYQLLNDQEKRQSVAVLFGIKIPTGQTNEEAPEEKLDAELQPGSGSWDPLLGLAYSKSWAGLSFDSNINYQLVTEGTQDTDLGDFAGINLALSHRLGSLSEDDHSLHDHSHLNWDLILEANSEWRDREDVDGETNVDSGGLLVFLSPGVRVSTNNGFSAAISAGIPVVTDLNGLQSTPQFRVIGNASFAF